MRTRRTVLVSATMALIAMLWVQPLHAATPNTIVTIGFDDGYDDQYQTLQMLSDHSMNATFFVNTGFLGDPGRLDWQQVRDLFAAGNEIGGHTLHHANVKKLKLGPATTEICDDRQNLVDNVPGLTPVSFAYPFGSFDALAKQIVASCGYTSGRGVSGVNDRRVFGETVPPLDAYATRTPPNPKQGTTLATIEGYVTAAENNGGGWVQLVFHHVCDGCDAYSITHDNLSAFLDWLSIEVAQGRITVQTTAQVMASA